MSTNHYSMNHLPETTLWWTQQQQQQHHQPIQPSWFNLNNNQNDIVEDDLETQENEDENIATTTENLEENKEPMFEKPLTPSDVGKLNRLVIPKQHAEKYFPLGASSAAAADTSSECKGLLLSFEDESGKCWRFRYSYWNSSQSYVLTKGWSRYVKDKRLDAGDVVLFERHRVDTQRLFINWRRRRVTGTEVVQVSNSRGYGKNGSDGILSSNKNEGGVGVGWTRGFYSAHPYPAHHHHHLSPYQQQHDHCLHAGRGTQQQGGQNQMTKPVGNNSSSSSNSSSNSKVLRLFGVNMECQSDQQQLQQHEHHSNSSYDGTTTTTTDHPLYYYHHQPSSNSNSHPHVVRHQPYYY